MAELDRPIEDNLSVKKSIAGFNPMASMAGFGGISDSFYNNTVSSMIGTEGN